MTHNKNADAEWLQSLADRPPRIRYATHKGIQVAIHVDDPHAERPYRRNSGRSQVAEYLEGCTCRIGAGVRLIRDPDCTQHSPSKASA
jgi:hypothetical protein